MSEKEFLKPKKRIPLPVKPPKAETKPNAYTRKQKHPKKWQEPDNASDESGGKT